MGKYNNKIENIEETPFNFAMLFYITLNRLLEKASWCAINDDIEAWYNTLQAIKRKISFKLSPDELKKISKVLRVVNNKLHCFPNNNERRSHVVGMNYNNIISDLDEAESLIMNYMHRYKMIFPNIKNNDNYAKMLERYDIGTTK